MFQEMLAAGSGGGVAELPIIATISNNNHTISGSWDFNANYVQIFLQLGGAANNLKVAYYFDIANQRVYYRAGTSSTISGPYAIGDTDLGINGTLGIKGFNLSLMNTANTFIDVQYIPMQSPIWFYF